MATAPMMLDPSVSSCLTPSCMSVLRRGFPRGGLQALHGEQVVPQCGDNTRRRRRIGRGTQPGLGKHPLDVGNQVGPAVASQTGTAEMAEVGRQHLLPDIVQLRVNVAETPFGAEMHRAPQCRRNSRNGLANREREGKIKDGRRRHPPARCRARRSTRCVYAESKSCRRTGRSSAQPGN